MRKQNKGTLELTQKQLQFYEENEKLVYYLLNKKGVQGPQFEELEQIGKIGLVKAIRTFDQNRRIKFSTYASTCIINEIRMFLRRNQKYQREISFETFVTRSEVEEITLLDTMKDEETSSLEEDFFYREKLIEVITILLSEFPFSKSYVMFLIIAGISQEKIGEILGITKGGISRRKVRAVKELRNKLKEKTRASIFQVTIQEGKLQVSFKPEAITNTKQVLQQLTLKAEENSININFKIHYSSQRVMLQFPLEKEAFLLLALLVQAIEENKKDKIR